MKRHDCITVIKPTTVFIILASQHRHGLYNPLVPTTNHTFTREIISRKPDVLLGEIVREEPREACAPSSLSSLSIAVSIAVGSSSSWLSCLSLHAPSTRQLTQGTARKKESLMKSESAD